MAFNMINILKFRKLLICCLALPFSVYADPINNVVTGSDPVADSSLSVSDRLDETILNWAQQKVKSIFSYNWVDYKEVMDQSKRYFTPQGYSHYLKSLKDSGSTEFIISKKLILQVKLNGLPKILKEGSYQDKFSWQVEIPVVFTYYGVSETIPKRATVVLLISRASKVDFEDGLAITQLLLKPEA